MTDDCDIMSWMDGLWQWIPGMCTNVNKKTRTHSLVLTRGTMKSQLLNEYRSDW